MKFRAEYVIPFVILVLTLIISLSNSCVKYMPYDPEGYENISRPLETAPVDLASEKKDGGKGVAQAASAPAGTMRPSSEGFETLKNDMAKYGDEKPIDIYSDAKGDLDCEPSPYSNSKGYLCLDASQKAQLHTRGRNQS
jgi:hypothetical protein